MAFGEGAHRVAVPRAPDLLILMADQLTAAGLPAHATHVARCPEGVARHGNLTRPHAGVVASQRRRHAVSTALREGCCAAWNQAPARNASQPYICHDQDRSAPEAMARFAGPDA